MKQLFCLLIAAITCTDLYDPLKSSVYKLNKGNWSNNVLKGIQNGNIFLVHFYNPNDGESYEFTSDYEEKATKLKGIVNFGFVNC